MVCTKEMVPFTIMRRTKLSNMRVNFSMALPKAVVKFLILKVN